MLRRSGTTPAPDSATRTMDTPQSTKYNQDHAGPARGTCWCWRVSTFSRFRVVVVPRTRARSPGTKARVSSQGIADQRFTLLRTSTLERLQIRVIDLYRRHASHNVQQDSHSIRRRYSTLKNSFQIPQRSRSNTYRVSLPQPAIAHFLDAL